VNYAFDVHQCEVEHKNRNDPLCSLQVGGSDKHENAANAGVAAASGLVLWACAEAVAGWTRLNQAVEVKDEVQIKESKQSMRLTLWELLG
jgi:hypothetical protein